MGDEFDSLYDDLGFFVQWFDVSDPDYEEVDFPFAFDDDVVDDSSFGGSDD